MFIDQEKIDKYKTSFPLTFSEALEMLKFGLNVRRPFWQIDFIKIKKPNKINDGTIRHAIFESDAGLPIDLTASDILSDDWIIVE